MLLLNFAHPLTPSQLAAVEQLGGRTIEQVRDIKTQFRPDNPFAELAAELIEAIGLSSAEWQSTPLLVNPPSLSPIACVVLAELHGRMGYFPPILRLRAATGSVPAEFEVAEIVNLQTVRDKARERR